MVRPRKYDRKAVMLKLLTEMCKGDRCLERIIEESDEFPHITDIYDWVSKDTPESKELSYIFMRAQEMWCRAQVRLMIEIADDDSRDILENVKEAIKQDGTVLRKVERRSDNTPVNRDRNRIMARQWAITKLAPKIFGDKVEHTGAEGGPIQFQKMVDRPVKETPEEWQRRVQKQLEEKAKQTPLH